MRTRDKVCGISVAHTCWIIIRQRPWIWSIKIVSLTLTNVGENSKLIINCKGTLKPSSFHLKSDQCQSMLFN